MKVLILLLVKELSAPMLRVFELKIKKRGVGDVKSFVHIPSFLFAYQKLSDSRNRKYID